MEDKLNMYLNVLLTASQYRKDPEKMAEYIRKNKQYFPLINETMLEKIKKSN